MLDFTMSSVMNFIDKVIKYKPGFRAPKCSKYLLTFYLTSSFRVFDLDGDGKITVKELQQSLKNQGDDVMSEEKVIDIIKEFDTNNDGVIDFEEFCAMMRSGKF